jgi:hypothetical protein
VGLFNWLFGNDNNSIGITEPSVNIDGTPMCGSVDINGNPYGVTDATDCSPSVIDDAFDSCSMDDSFSSFDDSSCGGFDDW